MTHPEHSGAQQGTAEDVASSAYRVGPEERDRKVSFAPAPQGDRRAGSDKSVRSGKPSAVAATAKPGARPAPQGPRKAHLVIRRIEPWSVMKFSFVIGLVAFVVLFVAVAVLYLILSALGVFDALAKTVQDVTTSPGAGGGGINAAGWFSATRILGFTALVGALNVILLTALTTIAAVLYNVAADLVGGIEVTLAEAE